MIDTFLTFKTFVKDYPLVVGVITLWVGALAVYMRNFLRQILTFIRSWMFVNVTMSNGYDGAYTTLNGLLAWHATTKYSKLSRTYRVRDRAETGEIITGGGLHFFTFKGRFFWFRAVYEGLAQSTENKITLTIVTFVWNYKYIEELFQSWYTDDQLLSTRVRTVRDGTIGYITPVYSKQRQLISTKDYDYIDKIFDRICNNPEYYNQRLVVRREAFLLHGPAGTGKSSIARHMSSKYKIDLIRLDEDTNLNQVVGMTGTTALYILLFEDIDSVKSFLVRAKNSITKQKKEGEDEGLFEMDMSRMTLTGMLNYLDGVVPLNNAIPFFTTNFLEKIDNALYREGRFDHVLEIDYIGRADLLDKMREQGGKAVFDITNWIVNHFPEIGMFTANHVHQMLMCLDDYEEFVELYGKLFKDKLSRLNQIMLSSVPARHIQYCHEMIGIPDSDMDTTSWYLEYKDRLIMVDNTGLVYRFHANAPAECYIFDTGASWPTTEAKVAQLIQSVREGVYQKAS